MCHLKKSQCKNQQLKLKYRGPCKGDLLNYSQIDKIQQTHFFFFCISSSPECLESRSYAMAYKTTSAIIKFIPRCRADGSFASVQCMEGAGCWCSDVQGKPIPNTTTTVGKPKNCKRHTRVNIRRSPTRITKQSVQRDRTICRKSDQRVFNKNLIRVFHGEYKRSNRDNKTIEDHSVLNWKFLTLDQNADDVLDDSEYNEFRRLVRKIVKPKKCAKHFAKHLYCDGNDDTLLSPQEWRNCFLKENNGNR